MRTPEPSDPRSEAPWAVALTALFEAEADLDALERMLLLWARHPDGVAADAAWLLRWDAAREAWVGWSDGPREPGHGALDAELARARRSAAPTPATRALVLGAHGRPADWEHVTRAATAAWTESVIDEAPWNHHAGVAVAPLARGSRPHALLVAAWSDGERDHARLAALETLRRVAQVALNAQWRAAEARRRARLAVGIAEAIAALGASINVAEAHHLLLRLAVQGTAARGGALWTRNAEGAPQLALANGPAALRDRVAEAFTETAVAAMTAARATSGTSGAEAVALPPDVSGEVSAWAVAPMRVADDSLGALMVWDGIDRSAVEGGLDALALDHLATLAQVGGALETHARVLDERQGSERQRRELQRQLRAQDELATLGELASRVAQEARNPIASIGAFARRAHRALPEGDPQREYLEIVIREAGRLESMMQEQLQYAALEQPRLQLQDLNVVVQEALRAAGESLVRRRVRLVKKLAPDLPQLLLDAARVRRVLENVLGFALENVLVGGRVRVESRRSGGYVVLEIAHDGPRSGGDLLEHLFVPFATGAAGAAVGLGVAQQIVREHGGEIRVRSEGEWNAIFSCTFPVRENEDRRHGSDRRGVRPDRRRRPAA